MANAEAWNTGWQTGTNLAAHQRARKEMLSDEDRRIKADDFISQRQAILNSTDPNLTKEAKAAAITKIQTDLEQLYHPVHAPGALQMDWDWLRSKITRKPAAPVPAPVNTFTSPGASIQPADQTITLAATPADRFLGLAATPEQKIVSSQLTGPAAPVVIPPSTFKVGTAVSETMASPKVKGLVAPGNLPIWNRPVVQNADGSHSSEFSFSFVDENPQSKYYGKEVLVPTVADGKFLTPDGKKPAEGSAEEQAMFTEARKRYERTGQHLGVFENPKSADKYASILHSRGERPQPAAEAYAPKPPKPNSYEGKLQAQQDRAQQAAERIMMGAPPTPEEAEEQESSKLLASIQSAIKNFKAGNPDATPPQIAEFSGDIWRQKYGIPQKAVWAEYVSPDGKSRRKFDLNHPELIPPDWNATGAENADTRKRADFLAYIKEHPEYKGTFEQWAAEQGQYGKLAVPTNRDDRYIAIEQKRQLGTPLSEDEKAYAAAYDIYVKKRMIDPGVARAAAFGAMRYVQVLDPSNPEKVVLMRAGDASRAGLGTPASIGFQIDKAVTRYMVAGPGASNINYFNTAVSHLNLLAETADALNNGDIQLFNRWANNWAAATGKPAPTNFETVKGAVAGELSKTFSGKGATVEEIALVNQTINQTQSPEQLHGAITYYLNLMGGKLDALKQQLAMGKQGLAAFENPPGAGTASDQYIYATNGKKTIRAKKGTPLPQGWVITNGPAK